MQGVHTITKDFLVHVDETSFKLTTQTSKAFIWAFVGQSLTGYTFALTRGGDVPLDLLGKSTGAFLCDDYRGCDPLEKKGKRRRSGCLAHARRKYFEAGDVYPLHEDASSRRGYGLVTRNALGAAIVSDAFRAPRMAEGRLRSHAIQRRRDVLVGPAGAHLADDVVDLDGVVHHVLARLRLANTRLRMLAAA